MGERRLDVWSRRSDLPLSATAVVFLAAYAAPIIWPHLPHRCVAACSTLVWATWAVFAVDFAVRVTLVPRRLDYIQHHLLDVAVVALPVLRPLRLLRLITLLSVLNRSASHTLRGRVVAYVVGGTGLLLLLASLAVLDAERGRQGANIITIGDSLWWAATTMTTVGYGDRYPVTVQGRLVAVGLMLGGIALLGVVTASFATWLIDRVRAAEEDAQLATRADVAELTAQVQALRKELAAARGADAALPPRQRA